MEIQVSQPSPLAVLAVLAAVGLLVLFAAYYPPGPLRRIVEKCGGWSRIAGWVELPLIGLMAVAFLVGLVRIVAQVGDTAPAVWPGVLGFLSLGVPLLGALLAVQLIRNAAAAVWTAGLIFFGGIVWLYTDARTRFAKFLEDLHPEAQALHADTYFIPMNSIFAMANFEFMLWPLTGLVCYALLPRWWSFALGGAVLPRVINWLAKSLFSHDPTLVPWDVIAAGPAFQDVTRWAASTLFAFGILTAVWALPRTRAGLLRVSGLAEKKEERRIYAGAWKAGAFLFVLMSGLLLAGHAIIMVSLGNMSRLLAEGPILKPYSPAQVNGWHFLEERFVRGPGVPELPDFPDEMKELLEPSTLKEVRSTLEEIPPDLPSRFAEEMAPWTEAFRAASQADYISPNDGERYVLVAYYRVRNTARALVSAAAIAVSDDDWERAVEDLGVLYRYGAQELDDGTVGQMVQVAIRNLANRAFPLYWRTFRHDEEAMRALATLMDDTAAGNRRPFPLDILRRHEFGIQPVVPAPEIALPSLSRIVTVHQNSRASFDAVRIATAAALYEIEHGEWPAALEDLVPGYLPKVPRDPFEGQPWIYEADGERLLLETEWHRDLADRPEGIPAYAEPLSFPIIE